VIDPQQNKEASIGTPFTIWQRRYLLLKLNMRT